MAYMHLVASARCGAQICWGFCQMTRGRSGVLVPQQTKYGRVGDRELYEYNSIQGIWGIEDLVWWMIIISRRRECEVERFYDERNG